jgi:hypothetical protein
MIDLVFDDNEYEVVRGDLSQIHVQLNTAAAYEYFRYKSSMNKTLPFRKTPQLILAHMVYFSAFWLDSFPSKGGISSHIRTRTIITK